MTQDNAAVSLSTHLPKALEDRLVEDLPSYAWSRISAKGNSIYFARFSDDVSLQLAKNENDVPVLDVQCQRDPSTITGMLTVYCIANDGITRAYALIQEHVAEQERTLQMGREIVLRDLQRTLCG